MTQDIKRILYATDLSDNSAYAFGYALALAKKSESTNTILHVIDMVMGVFADMAGFYFNEKELEEKMQKRITHITEEINIEVKANYTARVSCKTPKRTRTGRLAKNQYGLLYYSNR